MVGAVGTGDAEGSGCESLALLVVEAKLANTAEEELPEEEKAVVVETRLAELQGPAGNCIANAQSGTYL